MAVFLRDPNPYLREFRRKPLKTSLGRQVRPRNEPGNSRLPVFEGSHWWGLGRSVLAEIRTRTFGVAAVSSNHYTTWSARV